MLCYGLHPYVTHVEYWLIPVGPASAGLVAALEHLQSNSCAMVPL